MDKTRRLSRFIPPWLLFAFVVPVVMGGMAGLALPGVQPPATGWTSLDGSGRTCTPLSIPGTEGAELHPEPAAEVSTTTLPAALPVEAELPPIPANPRLGFGMALRADPQIWAGRLGASWYLDWTVDERSRFQSPVHWQMVRLRLEAGGRSACSNPSPQRAAWLARHFPGQVWIIGNEPDVIWQDNLPAEAYAQAYQVLYREIKRADPRAKVAVGGVAQGTPLRLAYLDEVLRIYQEGYGQPLPADWWTVHGFVLREEEGSWGVGIPPGLRVGGGRLYEVADHARLDLFAEQIWEFRGWMQANGYGEVPLALTEFGILMPVEYGFPDDVRQRFLKESFTWLDTAADPIIGLAADEGRLVQRWAWFSLADSLYPAGDLGEFRTGRLTPLGEAFREFAREK